MYPCTNLLPKFTYIILYKLMYSCIHTRKFVFVKFSHIHHMSTYAQISKFFSLPSFSQNFEIHIAQFIINEIKYNN